MAIAYVSSAEGGGNFGGTSGSFNSTGADLLVVLAGGTSNIHTATISDNKGNTWTALNNQGGSTSGSKGWYAKNAIVGTGHTVTISIGNSTVSVFHVYALSGADLTTPLIAQDGNWAGPAETMEYSAGVSPTNGGIALCNVNCVNDLDSISINESYTIQITTVASGGNNNYQSSAYKLFPTGALTNPDWSWTGSEDEMAGHLVAFKEAEAVGAATSALMLLGVG